MIAAILRAQILSMRMAPTRGAIFSVITGVLWYGFWGFLAAFVGLWTAVTDPARLRTVLPTDALFVCLFWQLVPIVTAAMGSALDMRKLLVYPIPHRQLFLVEVLLRLTTGIEMLMVLIGGVTGLLCNPVLGGWAAVPRVLPPVVVFVAFNVLLASGVRSLLERLLSRRRVREVVVFLFLCLWMVPRLVVESGFQQNRVNQLVVLLTAVSLPWSAAAHAALGDFSMSAALSLSLWTLAAAWFGRSQFERSLRYDAIAAQATPLDVAPVGARWSERLYRFPALLWRDPVAAIVEKELRSLARSPRYRMVFVMGFSFGMVLWLPLVIGRQAGQHGVLARNFLPIVCVYALTLLGQVSYWNCFGFDRSAAAFYFVAPQPLSETLLGKNVASLVFVYLEVLILCGITAAFRLISGWPAVVETLVVVAICSLYLFGIGNISSMHYPRALTPERVSQGGATSRFQGLVFLLYPLALIPVFLAYVARWALDSELAFAVVLAIAAVIGAVVYWLAMESALSAAMRRREQIVEDLSKLSAPVATD